MADALQYCDICSRLIRQEEIASNTARIGRDFAVCAACAAQMSPEQREELDRRMPVPRGFLLFRAATWFAMTFSTQPPQGAALKPATGNYFFRPLRWTLPTFEHISSPLR